MNSSRYDTPHQFSATSKHYFFSRNKNYTRPLFANIHNIKDFLITTQVIISFIS